MFIVFSGGLAFSSLYKKQDNRFVARAFSTVVWLLGLPLIVFIGFNIFNIPWTSIDWLAAETWLSISFGVGFLLTPVLLFWAAERAIRYRDQQPYGRLIAVFSILVGIIALVLWLGLMLTSMFFKYV
jgi:hypothetical protein